MCPGTLLEHQTLSKGRNEGTRFIHDVNHSFTSRLFFPVLFALRPDVDLLLLCPSLQRRSGGRYIRSGACRTLLACRRTREKRRRNTGHLVTPATKQKCAAPRQDRAVSDVRSGKIVAASMANPRDLASIAERAPGRQKEMPRSAPLPDRRQRLPRPRESRPLQVPRAR